MIVSLFHKRDAGRLAAATEALGRRATAAQVGNSDTLGRGQLCSRPAALAAAMEIDKILKKLYAERDALDASIVAMEKLAVETGATKPRGRPPKWLTEARERAKNETEDGGRRTAEKVVYPGRA